MLIEGRTYLEAVKTLPISPRDDFEELMRDFLRGVDPNKLYSLDELLRMGEELYETLKVLGVDNEYISLYSVFDAIGLGEVTFYLYDEKVEEVMVNGYRNPVFVYRAAMGSLRTNVVPGGSLDRWVKRLSGRSREKIIDTSLDDMRISIVREPLSDEGPAITIRKHRKVLLDLVELMRRNTITPELVSYLWLLLEGLEVSPFNMIVAGNTGGGKTTTLNALLYLVPLDERIVVIEDTREIVVPHPNRVYLTTEGTDNSLMDLLIASLRMRPDRIVVGEVRGKEAVTLLAAMNVGHRAMGTIHANSAADTLNRLENPPMNVPESMLGALNLVVVQHRIRTPRGTIRRVTEVAELYNIGDRINMGVTFSWNPDTDKIERTTIPSHLIDKMAEYTHIPKKRLLEELERRESFLDGVVKRNGKPEDILRYQGDIV